MDRLRTVIGVDESGKGDFFGPLVIASFVASDNAAEKLSEMGVRDSKQIAAKKLLEIDRSLRDEYPCSTVVIGPEKYNQLYSQMKNLNRLLAWGHARAIENLLESNRADLAVSDKFGKTELIEKALMTRGRSVELQQLVRGESVIQVAAASIIARAAFVRQMERLQARLGMPVPRGAGQQVDQAGRALVGRYGPEILKQVAKVHFKNYSRVINPVLL